jgi:hypothetical protein
VAQPEVRGLDVDGHLRDVVLDVRVGDLVLRDDVFEREVVGGLRGAQERRRVVGDEAGLPAF